MKAIDVFKSEGLNPKINFIAQDNNGSVYGFQDKPNREIADGKWTSSSGYNYFSFTGVLQIEFDSDDWTKCIAERPVDYASMVGKWGIFADNESSLNLAFGKVFKFQKYSPQNGDIYPFFNTAGFHFAYFRPFTQEEKEEICK
ncbi:MAG: hypothetical protein LBT79_01735 [Elusimicrobiota bacterium]|jgi:hypothetical protein|nr:hypothetical protein [Elusimicrobiota bacterium]